MNARFVPLLCLLITGTALTGTPAVAQGELKRPVRILVPVPAGGTSDLVARLIADSLKDAVARPVVVENKPGATGQIAAELLKNAPPDGTTVMVAPIAVPVLAPLLFKQLRFEPARDFAPIAQIAIFTYALAVRADHPARGVAEFIDWAKANPTRASFGTGGAGSVPHFLGTMLARASGVTLQHVPYRGAGQVESELMGGDVAAGIGVVSDFLELHRAGKIRIIATSGAARSRQLPEVPTVREQGFATLEAIGWTGLFAPAGTPKSAIDAMSGAIVRSLRNPEMREKLIGIGVEPTGTTPGAFEAIIAADTAKWAAIVKASGFSAE